MEYKVIFFENQTQIEYKGLVNNLSLKSGYGTLYYENGNIKYQGIFADDKYHGYGTAYYDSGGIFYRGYLKNGDWDGYGEMFGECGTIMYRGHFKDCVFEGFGVLYHENRNSIHYIGTFKDDEFLHGEIFTVDSKPIYKGDFNNGTFEGQGECFSCNGTLLYKGEMSNGSFEGVGKMFHNDGKKLKYEGKFVNGRFHGYGILYDFNHENISNGIFKHGELQKNMLMTKEKVRDIFKEKLSIDIHEILPKDSEEWKSKHINVICDTLYNNSMKVDEKEYVDIMEFLKLCY
jgi:hypothetical protein